MPKLNPTPFLSVIVTKGAPKQGVPKSAEPKAIRLEAHPDIGVKVHGLGTVAWLRARRDYVPALSVGDLLHCSAGDPTTHVTLKVVAIGGVA